MVLLLKRVLFIQSIQWGPPIFEIWYYYLWVGIMVFKNYGYGILDENVRIS